MRTERAGKQGGLEAQRPEGSQPRGPRDRDQERAGKQGGLEAQRPRDGSKRGRAHAPCMPKNMSSITSRSTESKSSKTGGPAHSMRRVIHVSVTHVAGHRSSSAPIQVCASRNGRDGAKSQVGSHTQEARGREYEVRKRWEKGSVSCTHLVLAAHERLSQRGTREPRGRASRVARPRDAARVPAQARIGLGRKQQHGGREQRMAGVSGDVAGRNGPPNSLGGWRTAPRAS